ncbi:MAG: protein-methionine-sulfoxide reductase catalytic subunit MsrP [Rhodospirillales bacterium]|nr:protein-methionine-sulfoxide reductase catalytic subunit MsrP [Rhodospirillales bacterium]
MLIKRKKGWELPDSAATPEQVALNRRRFMTIGAVGAVAAAGAGAALWGFGSDPGGRPNGLLASDAAAQPATAEADPSAKLYPATRNQRYRLDRELTDEGVSTVYNNFYEFGSSKNIWKAAQRLPIRPWEIRIDGLVENPRTVGIDDLLAAMKLEERLYRHRCVEAWAMAVPWTGFPMKDFVAFAKPLSGAKYVRMETFQNAEVAPGQRAVWYPWPYVEGLTIEEATNDLTLLATGVYGKPMPRQMGAPIRLVTPWKYGFKSIKSVVRFTFAAERPKSFWEAIQAQEYGFWANVNPKVSHPRWSQASDLRGRPRGRLFLLKGPQPMTQSIRIVVALLIVHSARRVV